MKKIVSLLLALTILFTAMPVTMAQEIITVYVSVSQNGQISETQTGDPAIMLPVTPDANGDMTLDDVFQKLHDLYCPTPDGYSSSLGEFGAYVTKFWGNESGNFGYQVNGGTTAVMGLSHIVSDGDIIEAVIYQNSYPHTETYTKFDCYEKEVNAGETFALTLYEASYDENWNMVFSPCADATLSINGEITELLTDTDGNVEIPLETAGTYLVSAQKTKTVNEQEVPAITAPICVVTAKERYSLDAVHNIAQKYNSASLTNDANMPWLLCDIAVYNEIFRDSPVVLPASVKQACVDKLISDAEATTSASALAKSMLALRAMGFDAKNIYNAYGQKLDLSAKLCALIDAQSQELDNIYALPYLLLAVSQGDSYATREQIDFLLEKIISKKDEWQNDEWGTDSAAAMLPALALYADGNEAVASAIEETASLLAQAQDESGCVGNAASTGLVIAAFSAIRTDATTVKNGEYNLIDGLFTQLNETTDGFLPSDNSFSTEQGFRGLLFWLLLQQSPERIAYDFSSYPENEARHTPKTTVAPVGGGGGGGGTISKPKENKNEQITEESNDSKKDSDEKTETTTVEPTTLKNRNPDIKIPSVSEQKITFSDISEDANKEAIEVLAQRGIFRGKSAENFAPKDTLTRAEAAATLIRGLGLPEKENVGFSDVGKEDWFFQAVNTAYHYGIIKGTSDTQFSPNANITRQEAAVIVLRAAKLCGMEWNPENTRDVLAVFPDYLQAASWASDALAFCYANDILSDEVTEIVPAEAITRSEIARMLHALLENALPNEETSTNEAQK